MQDSRFERIGQMQISDERDIKDTDWTTIMLKKRIDYVPTSLLPYLFFRQLIQSMVCSSSHM